jgi:TIR domain
MTRIFLSYRRADTATYAKRIYDRLSADFGSDAVFMDVVTIAPGAKFGVVIEDAVSKCDVLLAMIGLTWLTATDESGRRLDHPEDLVRIEITSALASDVLVIPLL